MGSKAKKISTFAVQRGILPYTLFGILPLICFLENIHGKVGRVSVKLLAFDVAC